MVSGGLGFAKIVLILIPFIICFVIGASIFITSENDKSRLKRIINSSTVSLTEKQVTRFVKESKENKQSFAAKQNAKMNLLGINYKFEFLISVAIGLFVVGAIGSRLLFKAGPILMIYLGCLLGYAVFGYINSQLNKRKDALTIEFLEKMRDVASYLSVGKELVPAIQEAMEGGNISNVMFRELEQVRKDIFTNTKISEAFKNMYNRLQIEDIKMYAETLEVYERTGGNIITIMKSNDHFATRKLEIKNEQNIFAEKQKSQQKLIVGIPLIMIIFFFLFNPSFFGDFYSTFAGQVVAIICVSILVAGVHMSNQLAKIK